MIHLLRKTAVCIKIPLVAMKINTKVCSFLFNKTRIIHKTFLKDTKLIESNMAVSQIRPFCNRFCIHFLFRKYTNFFNST